MGARLHFLRRPVLAKPCAEARRLPPRVRAQPHRKVLIRARCPPAPAPAAAAAAAFRAALTRALAIEKQVP